MRPHRTLVVSALAVLALAVPSAAFGRALIIGGSTSVLPLAEKLAAAYHKATHQPTPKVTGGQSDIGISGVAEGRFDIGDSSRDPIVGVDPKGLTFTKIARDGVCVVTNKSNVIANMSTATVEEIFTGQKRDWSEVPGAKVTGPIEVFDRDGASGTQDAFQHIFLEENKKITSSATAKTSNGLEQQVVGIKKGAIGFVSFAYTSGLNSVGYNGVACNLRNARSGQYLGVRNFWMVTKGAPKGPTLKFLAWVTSGKKSVDNIINSQWIAVH